MKSLAYRVRHRLSILALAGPVQQLTKLMNDIKRLGQQKNLVLIVLNL